MRRLTRPPLIARRRRILVLLQDAALLTLAYAGGYFVRYDLMAFSPAWLHFEKTALAVVTAKALVLLLAGTYRGLMAYATVPDLLLILRNSTLASLAAYALLAFSGYTPSSRGVLVVDWMLTVGLLAASRLVFRALREDVLGLNRSSRAALKKVLIAGAGQAGVALAKDLLASRRGEVEVIGFVDDDPGKQGATLLGLPILGTTGDLGEIPRCRPVDQVIVAIPSAPPRVLNRIAEAAGTVVSDVRIVPPLEALLKGKEAVVAARAVPEVSFLSRGPVDLGAAGLDRYLEGRTVLVTGAGGSIGSELARQLARHGASHLRKLILLDCAETPLYDVHRQAGARLGKRAVPVLASVRDLHRVGALLASERPDVLLHAAALKHVPMCEAHPLEALATNTWATCRLAELARDNGVSNFTLVSTDKAVAPACVMGATKRAAETYLQSLAGGTTRFAAVRFGNVLGSNGSLLPLFHEQIRKGGPVTVTDPRATRFFMTIPEACGLILQATRIALGGEVFVLDMGEPVRILDLAQSLIRLYGYEPGRDIEVRIIGLRAGEKLHESLVDEDEEAEPVEHAKLMRVRGRSPDPERCRLLLAALERRLFERDLERAVHVLHALVPGFVPVARPEPVRALAGAQAVAS